MKPLITDSGASSENALIYVPTGNTDGLAASNAVDSLVALVFSLPSQHRNNAVFTMNSSTAAKICSLKDQNGQSIWLENYSASAPSKLLGYPVIILEDMPDIATNAYPIAFGNFKAGYTIVERPEIRILRDQYSQKPHVLFFVSKRTGGGVVDNTAIQLLKCAVS
jgi:HK97 family phage major capsid protein